MKIALLSTAMAGVLAVSALATPSFAQDYRNGGQDYRDAAYDNGYGPTPCQQAKRSNSTAGTLFGGILGAVIGSNLAHGGGRTGGAVIGGLAGAAIGSNVARSSADNSPVCEGGQYAYAPPPPPPEYRRHDRYADDGYGPPPPPQYRRHHYDDDAYGPPPPPPPGYDDER